MSEEIKQGFYRQSFFDYIAGEGINRSFLHEMIMWTPGHAKWKEEHEEITPALRLGDAFHAAILEPERFAKEYVVLPLDCKAGTSDNPNKGMKANLASFKAQCKANNQTIIQPDDQQNIREMAAVIQSDQESIDLLCDGESEISGYFMEEEYQVLTKIRLDYINKKQQIILDLKSCADARKGPFRKSAYDHGYDMQAFMALLGVTQITGEAHNIFKFICVESKGFHGVKVWDADEEMLDTGYKKYRKAMMLYKECLERNEWNGYDSTSEPLGSPSWAKESLETMSIYD